MVKKGEFMSNIAPLLEKPCFTAKEAREKGVHPSLLSYYANKGLLERVARGVYQAKTFEVPMEIFQWEELIHAVNTIPNGVICLISALDIYGITDEIPRSHWIGIPHTTSAKKRKNFKTVRFRNIDLGKTEIDLHGIVVPIFDIERTIVDAFRMLSKETAIKALKMALNRKEKLDLNKLQQYAKKLKFNITPYLMTLTT